MKDFKVGDVVKVREWQDMLAEFGIDENCCIPCEEYFTESMKVFCGHTARIDDFNKSEIYLDFDIDKLNEISDGYVFSRDMIEPFNENRPDHYKIGEYECKDEMIALFGKEAFKTFCRLNIYKYRYRATKKGGEKDIEKVNTYMRMLEEIE